ncbi:hypothetical protein PH586_08520 [Pseudomonas sp. SA3-5]|uniref:CARDB domain-containing protein n=1 Tax=Pseudomonas aestuarii TaxID=3018340 RepID=A0ABT4XDZ7_9PSED|nr:hypothetical protein [Pseudomonas aestuarii]MDA7086420.1 hypothetical protein [Pseudomonas aestuarii]
MLATTPVKALSHQLVSIYRYKQPFPANTLKILKELKAKILQLKFSHFERAAILTSLIASAISLVAIAQPAFIKITKGNYAKLNASTLNSTTEKFSLAILNDGNSSAAVKSIKLQSYLDGELVVESILPLRNEEAVIEPGKTIVISSKTSKLNSIVAANSENPEAGSTITKFVTTECLAIVNYVIPSKKSETYEHKFTCYAFTFL